MAATADQRTHRRGLTPWVRFLAGVALLAGVVLVLMQGYTPPGPAGQVFRHNLRHGIDATPLFYTDVESLMPDE